MIDLIIDVFTEDVNTIVKSLRKLTSTCALSHEKYSNSERHTKIKLRTTLTKKRIEDWLYSSNKIPDYIDVYYDRGTI